MAGKEPQKHNDTPTKAKIQGAVEFCEAMGFDYYKEDVFRHFKTERTRGYVYLRNDESPRCRHNNPDLPETCGRNPIVSPKDIREMERILKENDVQTRALT